MIRESWIEISNTEGGISVVGDNYLIYDFLFFLLW